MLAELTQSWPVPSSAAKQKKSRSRADPICAGARLYDTWVACFCQSFTLAQPKLGCWCSCQTHRGIACNIDLPLTCREFCKINPVRWLMWLFWVLLHGNATATKESRQCEFRCRIHFFRICAQNHFKDRYPNAYQFVKKRRCKIACPQIRK